MAAPPSPRHVRCVVLAAPDGRQVLVNGDFSAAGARWFLTGRYYFLPWHADNVVLELLIDRGLAGLALFVALWAAALAAWTRGAGRKDRDAPFHAAALCGYALVGIFASEMDVPRVAFLFLMLTGFALIVQGARRVAP